MDNLIIKAKKFAAIKHRGQLYDGGEPFTVHPEKVAEILSLVTQDVNLIAAAHLHDTLEDTETTYEELVREFNKDIADLVLEVTHEGKKDTGGYYFPRLKTQRGIQLKFADRLSNISRMEKWSKDRKDQYLRKSKFWRDQPVVLPLA